MNILELMELEEPEEQPETLDYNDIESLILEVEN